MAEKKVTTRTRPAHDISGQRFGRWIAVSYVSSGRWICRCDCGSEVIVDRSNLIKRRSKSCGCHRREASRINSRTHGHTVGYKPRPEYRIWCHAKARCFNPNTRFFERYGGRGITMSTEWADDFTAFYRDMGPRPEGTELDRIDNDGPYTGPCAEYPTGNCRWTTRRVQIKNTSVALKITHDGETLSLREWSERTGISLGTLHSRRERGLPLFGPVIRGGFRLGHRSRRPRSS